MIAEFSAGVLLRYSETYPYRLITEEQQKENPEVTQTPAPTEVAVPTETPNVPSSGGVSAQENPEDSDEVKAEENLRAKSLKVYCDKYNPKTAIKTSMSNYRKQEWMTNIPLWLVFKF